MVYPRRGYETLDGQLPANVSILNASLLDISSTEIRERIKRGESISGMVPRSIENLVKTNYEL
jgi:nicotinate-nucleotide adenylyltransferase